MIWSSDPRKNVHAERLVRNGATSERSIRYEEQGGKRPSYKRPDEELCRILSARKSEREQKS